MSELLTAGCDEVGRGAFFGPVCAATVVLDPAGEEILKRLGVKDSKKLSEKKRKLQDFNIRQHCIACAIASCSVEDIEMMGIEYCNMFVMRRSLEIVLETGVTPSRFWVDGDKEVPGVEIPQRAIKHGDQSEIAIAAASVIAKVYRDNIIIELAKKYPYYRLESNKGYHSDFHASALRKLGMTPSHRPSFCRKFTTQYNTYTDF